MRILEVQAENRMEKYPGLFGSSSFKKMPLYLYAENLLYNGMSQMIKSYNGGYYEYFHIIGADVEIEPSGFMPLINSSELVEIKTPFGGRETLTLKAASLVVWLIVIEQIANQVDHRIKSKLYNTMQDIHYCYGRVTDKSGNRFFNENDCRSICRLLD